MDLGYDLLSFYFVLVSSVNKTILIYDMKLFVLFLTNNVTCRNNFYSVAFWGWQEVVLSAL